MLFADGSDANNLLDELSHHLAPFLAEYIWQRDHLQVHAHPSSTPPWIGKGQSLETSGPPSAPPPGFLWGQLNYGDNVEDEWFVTWLILEVTRAFPVSARIWDSDGEFLLIEAAYSLPKWLRPEVAANRVWLRNGSVHIIPPAAIPVREGAEVSTLQALEVLRCGSFDTAGAGAAVNNALQPRLKGFPGRAQELMHRAHALIPARLAHVLEKDPLLVAAAVEAFYYRDPYDARSASRMIYFPPQNMVLASVRFSKCLYAQVALQTFSAPKGWPELPAVSSPQHAAALLGLKVTAGFEMLCAQHSRDSKGEAIRAGMAAERALQLANEPFNAAALAAAAPGPADSDVWLREGPAMLEKELQMREKEVEEYQVRKQQKRQRSGKEDGGHAGPGAEAFDPGQLSAKVNQFMEMISGLEGAEVSEDFPNFDEGLFLAELQKVLTLDPSSAGTLGNASSSDGEESSEEGSSFYSDQEEDDKGSGSGTEEPESDEEGRQRWQVPDVDWDAATGTDSDDEVPTAADQGISRKAEDRGFLAAYDQVLAAQLAGTTLDESFVTKERRVEGGRNIPPSASGKEADGAAAPGEREDAGDGEAGQLAPVDLDVNLVSSLLASYKEQGGLPGPASTLAGLLGVELPNPDTL